MKHICVSEENSSGFVGKAGNLFLNIEKQPQDPLGRFAPVSCHFPIYVLDRTYAARYDVAEQFPDYSLKAKELYIPEVYRFVVDKNREIQALLDKVEELRNTPSESVEVADPIGFQDWLDEVRATKHNLDDYLQYFDHVKLRMFEATGNSSGISGITKVSIVPGTSAFNEAYAKSTYEEEYFECCEESLGERFEVNHTRRFELKAKHYEAPDLSSIGGEKDPDQSIERLHKEYCDQKRRYELEKDRHGVELLKLKIAIGTARNVPLCYNWVREPVLKFNVAKFRALYPELYDACRKTSEPKWKCEILDLWG